jgi:hypothetical protein
MSITRPVLFRIAAIAAERLLNDRLYRSTPRKHPLSRSM